MPPQSPSRNRSTERCEYYEALNPCLLDRAIHELAGLWTISKRMICLSRAAHNGADLEESGWKMVSGDVFRAPKDIMRICVQTGSGVQIIISTFITLCFAALGEWHLLGHGQTYGTLTAAVSGRPEPYRAAFDFWIPYLEL